MGGGRVGHFRGGERVGRGGGRVQGEGGRGIFS